jgi:predicted nucleic acid-binding protein
MSDERLLLDATFIAGYLNARDQHHSKAKECIPRVEAAHEVVITEAVLVEVGNLLHATQHRRRAAQFIEACYGTDNITIIPVSTHLLGRAIEFYRQHDDKDWGLTDCISFVVMREHDLTMAVTADTDFQQAGFRALMLEE